MPWQTIFFYCQQQNSPPFSRCCVISEALGPARCMSQGKLWNTQSRIRWLKLPKKIIRTWYSNLFKCIVYISNAHRAPFQHLNCISQLYTNCAFVMVQLHVDVMMFLSRDTKKIHLFSNWRYAMLIPHVNLCGKRLVLRRICKERGANHLKQGVLFSNSS